MADEAFEPGKRAKNGSSGNWWRLLMLHITWIILTGGSRGSGKGA